jgi:hypothetical protein
MTKKPKPPAFARWRISLLKGTPARFLGYIEAPDEKGRGRRGGEGIQDRRGAAG